MKRSAKAPPEESDLSVSVFQIFSFYFPATLPPVVGLSVRERNHGCEDAEIGVASGVRRRCRMAGIESDRSA